MWSVFSSCSQPSVGLWEFIIKSREKALVNANQILLLVSLYQHRKGSEEKWLPQLRHSKSICEPQTKVFPTAWCICWAPQREDQVQDLPVWPQGKTQRCWSETWRPLKGPETSPVCRRPGLTHLNVLGLGEFALCGSLLGNPVITGLRSRFALEWAQQANGCHCCTTEKESQPQGTLNRGTLTIWWLWAEHTFHHWKTILIGTVINILLFILEQVKSRHIWVKAQVRHSFEPSE